MRCSVATGTARKTTYGSSGSTCPKTGSTRPAPRRIRLRHPAASPELRRVLDQTLEGVLRLIRAARPLPRRIRNRGLRLKAAVILVMAEMLAAKLGKQDPLAGRVALSKPERMRAGLRGVARGLKGR